MFGIKKDNKFTTHDKAKEMAVYIAGCPETEMHIENTPEFSPKGVAVAKTFLYKNQLTQIKYNKWIVEGAQIATQMELPGYEKHNQLIRGSAVRLLSKKFDHIFNFYGQDAYDIINACEKNRLQKIYELTNNMER